MNNEEKIMIIEIRIYDDSDEYLFEIYKTAHEGDALVWLRDMVNSLRRPLKIRINYLRVPEKKKSDFYPCADENGMVGR